MPDAGALLTLLRYGCLALGVLALAGMARRILLWRRGRPADVAIASGLAALPMRYFRDVHEVVARDRLSALMHMCAAGGFVAAGLLFVVDLMLDRPPGLRWPGLLASSAMAAGATLAVFRRVVAADHATARRSVGEWSRFVAMIAILALGLAAWFAASREDSLATPLLLVAVAAILAGGLEIGFGMLAGGPIRHVFAGAANLAFHPRPARFSSTKPDAALRTADLADARLGLAAAEDLGWNRVLNLDACVQCGRCEAACPAFDAGQPLNPKALVHDLARASGLGAAMGAYAGSSHPGLASREGAARAAVVPDHVAAETLWSCTTCRACVSACPMMIEHVDFIIDLRRHEALEKGALPGKSATVLTH
ncbi:MAG: DUF3483 domain-containing protein, partial [Methylobacteriaceae bacterium]|nr:DUF3483 domain-containing protein [Methylobacteriaceae bacterium]